MRAFVPALVLLAGAAASEVPGFDDTPIPERFNVNETVLPNMQTGDDALRHSSHHSKTHHNTHP